MRINLKIIKLSEKVRPKRVYAIWFHLCKTLENANKSLVKKQISGLSEEVKMERDGKEGLTAMRKLLGMKDMFIILIVVMISCVYTYVKTYQIVLKICYLLDVNYDSIKLLKKFFLISQFWSYVSLFSHNSFLLGCQSLSTIVSCLKYKELLLRSH